MIDYVYTNIIYIIFRAFNLHLIQSVKNGHNMRINKFCSPFVCLQLSQQCFSWVRLINALEKYKENYCLIGQAATLSSHNFNKHIDLLIYKISEQQE